MTIPDRTKEAAMISYQWSLSPDQPFNKEELYKLQYCLYAAGIFMERRVPCDDDLCSRTGI